MKSDIPKDHPIYKSLKKISNDIRLFIELSLREEDFEWEKWIPLIVKEARIKCWEKKGCYKLSCPAYKNPHGRCWLVAGTMCGCGASGDFAVKYKSCTECDVYKEAVFYDPVIEVYEHLITLVHSLKETNNRLVTMATRDLLTGLYNRNYFNETIVREAEKSKRYGERLSIVMIDIDNFKDINDTYGHLHGDGILRECALILRRSARASDMICRFGGDEFIIVAPEIGCSENETLISRIKDSLTIWNDEYASQDYKLSMSFGCSIWEAGKNLHDVINEADRQMYEDKKTKNPSY